MSDSRRVAFRRHDRPQSDGHKPVGMALNYLYLSMRISLELKRHIVRSSRLNEQPYDDDLRDTTPFALAVAGTSRILFLQYYFLNLRCVFKTQSNEIGAAGDIPGIPPELLFTCLLPAFKERFDLSPADVIDAG